MPPVIISQPPAMHISVNKPKNLTVHYQSKNRIETHISWYKDGNSLQNGINRPLNASHGLTQMTFDPIRRRDRGEYVVVIENSHSIIPINQRRVEARFTVSVSILPAIPTPIRVSGITDKAATLSWSLILRNNDESADNQTVTVYLLNGTMAYQRVVGGDIRQEQLSLIPAERYYAQVKAENEDGYVLSQNRSFQALIGGKRSEQLQ